MLAGVEAMRRHRDILLGCQFTWVTDHRGLTHLLKQKDLSPRQARWIEKISEFNFNVEYVPGLENILPDALSRLYSNDAPGTVRAQSEYTQFDDDDDLPLRLEAFGISVPVLVNTEGRAARNSVTNTNELKPRRRSPRLALPPETGRPETAKEFSKRIRKLIVHGPRAQRAEGAPAAADIQATDGTSVKDASETQPLTLGHRSDPPTTTPELSAPIETNTEDPFLGLLAENTDGLHIPDIVRGRYQEDAFFGAILADPKQFKNFRFENGLLLLHEHGFDRLCIPNVVKTGRSVREIIISHAHSLLAHLGTYKTLGVLRDHVWWKTMASDVRKYCETCETCKRSKPDNQKPYGLLNPLPVPSLPWEAIGIDFVGPLPLSENRDGFFDSITVIIDLLTSMVHLVPSKTSYNVKYRNDRSGPLHTPSRYRPKRYLSSTR